MAIIQTPSIANVVEDQTPQLGGDLDCQDYRLEWSGSSQYIGSTTLGAGLTVSSGSNNLTLTSSGNLSINTNAAERAIFQSGGGLSVGGDIAPLSVGSLYDLGTTSLRWATTYTDGIATNVETFTAASDTLDALNNVCLCDCSSNAITLALPVPVAGLQFHIKKIDGTANTVNIEPDDPGPELIDGAIVQTLSSQYDSTTVVSDGSNWFLI